MTPVADQAERADVVIGLIPPDAGQEAIEGAISRIAQSNLPLRAALIHPSYSTQPTQPSFRENRWKLIAEPRLRQDPAAVARSLGDSFRVLFDATVRLEARACAIITSDLATVTAEWVEKLLYPALEESFDLVTPCYAANPFDGLINRAIVYPMVRALYGKRIRNPMGPDFGLSARLIARMSNGLRPRLHPLVSLVPEAVASEMRICQAHLGARIYASIDWSNLSPFISQALDALFQDVERFAPWWQRARGSQPIQEYGNASRAQPAPAPVQPGILIPGFQAGVRALIGIWGTVLPPSTIVELQKLAREEPGRFRMQDETWARIVYDFALAHRLRAANREQTLRAFTPIYLGWVGSYALETADATSDAVEQRIEELCNAFERMKPYFLSRWRWPDRFNP